MGDEERHLKVAPSARLRWDKLDGKHVLLSPERGLTLSASATEIVQLCDGTRSASGIVRACIEGHADADPGTIERDVRALLRELLTRRLVVELRA